MNVTTGPYADTALLYRELGWMGVLPLPPREKSPIPEGFTGRDGGWPTPTQIETWRVSRATGNVALRLPEDVIGVDVDAYGTKRGAETLDEVDRHVGPLPRTWISTARSDGVSGIRWFRVPPGRRWRSDLGRDSGVEIIRHGHRFAVVWPSVHPETGTTYRWVCPTGAVSDRPPRRDELAELPDEWVTLLEKTGADTRRRPDDTANALGLGVASSWTELVEHYAAEVRGGATRNETGKDLALQLRDNGCPLGDALRIYMPLFVHQLGALAQVSGGDGEPYTAEEACNTARSIYAGGGPRGPLPGFERPAAVSAPGGSPPATPPVEHPVGPRPDSLSGADLAEISTDLGNTRRLIRLHGHRLRYVEDTDEWLIRRPGSPVWERRTVHAVVGLTEDVVTDVRGQSLSPDLENTVREHLARWAAQCESLARRKTMVEGLKSVESLSRRSSDLDADPLLLATPSAVLDLTSGRPVDPRDVDQRDVVTRRTSVNHEPGATSPDLDEFVETFLPGEGEADFVWKVLGSALLGGNVHRLLLIALGGTTSGKSMLAEAVSTTLGGYAVPVGTSVFRANQDDRPRPDLLRALPARLAYAQEASEHWELHTDQVKRLTGGDPIVARAMHSNTMVERAPSFTPLIITNEMPRIKGADAAICRRLLVLKFGHTLPPGVEDVTIKDRFIRSEEVQRAILARLVDGCLRSQREKIVEGIPTSFVRASLDAFEELDHVETFLLSQREAGVLVPVDAVQTPSSQFVQVSELYAAYRWWVATEGDADDRRQQLGRKQFVQRLKSRGWETIRSNGIRVVGWHRPTGDVPRP